jgi:hypothetical protein
MTEALAPPLPDCWNAMWSKTWVVARQGRWGGWGETRTVGGRRSMRARAPRPPLTVEVLRVGHAMAGVVRAERANDDPHPRPHPWALRPAPPAG